MLRWIGAFLLERSQCVRIGNSRSIAQNINGGIPQGTISLRRYSLMLWSMISYLHGAQELNMLMI
jgi:hypothetical protein